MDHPLHFAACRVDSPISSTTFQLQSLLAGALRRIELDRAVLFALLARAWPFAVGPVTLVFIATHLTPQQQGFYYTFASLLTLQSFLELGFLIVITQFASHEWACLHIDARGYLGGDAAALSRLVSLGRLAFRWFALAAALFIVAVGVAGYLFFQRNQAAGVTWAAPWLLLVLITGLQLTLAPLIAILDGCNQVRATFLLRFLQTVGSSFVLWLVLVAGGALWAAPAAAGSVFLVTVFFLLARFRHFLVQFLLPVAGPRISWGREIWPMQWRLAASAVAGFFAFSLFSPVMFHYYGPVVAGQMGMSWQITSGLGTLALAWVATRVPRFGVLIADRSFSELDQVFRRAVSRSLFVLVLGGVAAWLFTWGLYTFHHPFAQRLLPPLPMALLLIGAVVMHASACESAYLRAHKQEPIMAVSVVSSLLIGGAVWLLGSRLGPTGAAVSYAGIAASVLLPWETVIWLRCRASWHRP